MPKFESFAPQVENTENEVETSLEKRKSVIEKLTKKFPQLRSLVLAFITTTAAMSAPELAQTGEIPQGTKIEQKASVKEETAESALEKIKDQKFKDIVQKLKEEMAKIGNDVPTNSLYSEISEYLDVNGGETDSENKVGNLPESAKNVFISHEVVSGDGIQDRADNKGGTAYIMDGIKTAFYISPVEKGQIVEGGKIEIEGVGSTRSQAFQNALEDGAKYIEVEVSSDTSLDDTTADIGDKSFSESITTRTTKSSAKHFIKEYKIIKVEQGKGKVIAGEKDYHVTVEITGGQFTPEK